MNYTPINPRLTTTPDRVKLCKMVAREFLTGSKMGPIKRMRIAPGWIVEEVKKELMDLGFIKNQCPQIHPIVVRRPVEIDKASIARRRTPAWPEDCRGLTETWPRPRPAA